MDGLSVHRPRNLDWKRAAALLYGDWGTSKAYVIGFAFFFSGYASMPIIIAVCILTALVAYNYVIVCKHFPDGGGVYSAARDQSRLLGAIGALLLVANFIVTAALSCNSAMNYFGLPREWVALITMGTILAIGGINYFGPKHSGSLAVWMAVPMVAVVVLLILISIPFLSFANLEPSHEPFALRWQHFVGVILALSGVEAIANLTGVMKPDPESTPERPRVTRTSRRAILPVAVEVVLGTALLGWAMLSLPRAAEPSAGSQVGAAVIERASAGGDDLLEQRDYMLRYMGQEYSAQLTGSRKAGRVVGVIVGVVVGVLLLSAVNTAIAAQIGLVYMLARDGELPRSFVRLNSFGVPWWPWIIATVLPAFTVMATGADMEALARLYAIGVVGAITVNLGSCTFNLQLPLAWYERGIMGLTFTILFAVELTIARVNNDALFFATCVLGVGLGLRGYTQRRAGYRTVTVRKEIAEAVAPKSPPLNFDLRAEQNILVAARGLTPVLRFALEEAKLRRGALYVLYVKELAVALPGPLATATPPRWQEDAQAAGIMTAMLEQGREHGVQVLPVYVVAENPADSILDLAATFGIDMLILGSPHRNKLVTLLKGDVVTEVARSLPENIQLVIYG
jgi:amino acid transporter/nucleotide-binding universal stress UspA family protein